MQIEEARRRVDELRRTVETHDRLYFQESSPRVPDQEYDGLKAELARLERTFPELARDDSPSRRVGDDRLPGFQTCRHRSPMRSLDNTYSEDDLRAFHQRLARAMGRESLEYVVEPKIDGVAVSLTFEAGRFVRAVTRGNGLEGDDVTENIRGCIRSLPRTLGGNSPPAVIEIRGEIFMTSSEFQRINRQREEAGQAVYANPRNLTSGTIKLLDRREVAQRRLDLVLYGLGYAEGLTVETQDRYHRLLGEWGLPTVEKSWLVQGIDDAWRAIQELDEIRDRFAYATDGAVVKLNSLSAQREIGATARSPRWAIAYKFAAERAETVLRAISIQVGRTGVLTPVAELEPIQLAGSTVSRATLHNAEEIARKDVRVGDSVLVEKAGEIIPAVIEVNREKRPADSIPYAFPVNCPICGTKAVQREGEVARRCPNSDCPAQVRRRVSHFVSRQGLDIDGLGEAVVDQLVSKKLVTRLSDLYRLKREDLLDLDNFGEKSVDNLMAAIESSRTADLWRVIHGLGIHQVGATTARDLAQAFHSLEALAAASLESLVAIEGIGEKSAEGIRAFFEAEANRNLIDELTTLGLDPESPVAGDVAARGLRGRTFVLTGSLPTMTREEARAKVEATGARVSSSVSRKTDFLVAGSDAGSKLAKARKLGVEIIDEARLEELLTESD